MQSGEVVQLWKVVTQQTILSNQQPTVFTDYAIKRSSTIRNTEHFLYNRSQLCQPHLVAFQNATKWGIIKEPALSLPLSRKGGGGGGAAASILNLQSGDPTSQALSAIASLLWPLKGGVKGLPPAFWIPYLVIYSLKLGQLLQVFPDLKKGGGGPAASILDPLPLVIHCLKLGQLLQVKFVSYCKF